MSLGNLMCLLFTGYYSKSNVMRIRPNRRIHSHEIGAYSPTQSCLLRIKTAGFLCDELLIYFEQIRLILFFNGNEMVLI